MLRVGLHLPRSAYHLFQPLCTVLPCNPLHFLSIPFHSRCTSHGAAKLLPTSKSNTIQNVPDDSELPTPEGFLPKLPQDPRWKFKLMRDIIREPIRAWRHPRRQAKSANHDLLAGSIEGRADGGMNRIMIHPIHRRPGGDQDDPTTDYPLQKLLPRNGLLETSHQQCTSGSPKCPQSRYAWLKVLSKTQSVDEAWDAYHMLLTVPKRRLTTTHAANTSHPENGPDNLNIPYPFLHRLARLLASTHPRTRQLFLRLLSVLTTLRNTGGPIFVWEWNALVDCAGKGWRKTHIEDYRAAVEIFKDMVTSGHAVSSKPLPQNKPSRCIDTLPADMLPVAKPDIITFTTLLNIASRTLTDSAIMHAMSLLSASGLPWNQATHMARLPYFIHTNQLNAVRGILSIGVTRGLDLTTLNGCLWAYAYKGRLRITMQVYDLLRRNIPASDRADLGESNLKSLSLDSEENDNGDNRDENPFLNMPGFIEQATMVPNAVTYSLVIQALCYHGDLIGGLTVFRDMVSTVDLALRPRGSRSKNGKKKRPVYYKPSSVVYRAIFLGFARHANKRPSLVNSLISRQQGIDPVPLPEFAARLTASYPKTAGLSPIPESLAAVETPWTLGNLEKIFERFLEMDWAGGGVAGEVGSAPGRPSDRMIYWIMVAYAKTTNRDVRRMYQVWKQLDTRFGFKSAGVTLGGRLGRIGKELEKRQHQE